jgi:UDP-N-acetylmuramoylalanine--D-glutamate ligase
VYLIGDAASELADAFAVGGVPTTISGEMATALAAARAAADPGDTVLLAPACTSFDQYPNFEARGAHFRAVATAMGVQPNVA